MICFVSVAQDNRNYKHLLGYTILFTQIWLTGVLPDKLKTPQNCVCNGLARQLCRHADTILKVTFTIHMIYVYVHRSIVYK